MLAKLVWYRAGGEVSKQQWRDIAGVLAISGPDLDRTWLEHWADRLAARDLLTRIEVELEGAGARQWVPTQHRRCDECGDPIL